MTIKTTLLTTAMLSFAVVGVLGADNHADACSFAEKGVYDVQKVEYWHAPNNYNYNAPRCDWDTGRCSLSGWMISRHDISSRGNLPAIIFQHGSEGGVPDFQVVKDVQSLTEYSCAIKKFVDAGYVVYMPYRHGVFDDTDTTTLPTDVRGERGWSNSGWAANEWAINNVIQNGWDMNTDNYVARYITYLQMEVDDSVPILNRLGTYVRPDMTQRLVDPSRIAIVGHSIGGAMATFAGTDDDLFNTNLVPRGGPRAFVSLSGAAMSHHDSHWWHDILTLSASINNAPLVFTRAIDEDARTPNDFASAREPFAALGHFPQKSGMALFTAVGATCSADVDPWQCQHSAFVQQPDQIARWFPYVDATLHVDGM